MTALRDAGYKPTFKCKDCEAVTELLEDTKRKPALVRLASVATSRKMINYFTILGKRQL